MRALIALALLAGVAAEAEPLQPALSARIGFHDLAGQPVGSVPPGAPFRIRVQLDNLAGPDAPAGLTLSGWLRPVTADNSDCAEAARAFRATSRIPTDAIDLNGPVLAVLGEDNSLTLVDPDLDLASANLIGATRLDSGPAALLADGDGGRFLMSLPDQGQVVALPSFGGTPQVLAAGLDHPRALYAADGRSVWVQEATQLRLLGATPDITLAATRAAANGQHLVAWGGGAVHVRDAAGRAVLDLPEPAGLRDAIPISENGTLSAVVLLDNGSLAVHYADSPQPPQMIALQTAPDRIAADRTGRWLLAWSGAAGRAEIVDLARGQSVQRIGASTAISEILFGEGSVFLMMADHGKVGAIDLNSLRPDRAVQIREIALGNATPARAGETLLIALPGRSEIMAIHPETYTGFFIHDYSAMGDAPPMSAIRLRGGIPLAATALDRGFREVAPAVFETVAQVPDARPYELVATTGIASLSFCMALPGAQQTAPVPKTGRILIVPAKGRGVHLVFRTPDARPAPVEGVVTFDALMTGWHRSVTLSTDADGQSRQVYVLPDIGPIAISVRSRDGRAFDPTVTGARP